MQQDRDAVGGGAVDRDLELARQVVEFRMERRPLAQDFGERPWIDELVGRDAREMVGGDVAHAVSTCLDRVHLDVRELREDLGDVGKPRPVELQVLARAEVAVISVVLASNVRQFA